MTSRTWQYSNSNSIPNAAREGIHMVSEFWRRYAILSMHSPYILRDTWHIVVNLHAREVKEGVWVW